MVKDIYDRICEGVEVRTNLIALKKEISEESKKRSLAYLLEGNYSILVSLLENSDPKVRKNAALILGEMEDEDLKEALLRAYQRETQRFVRTSYLKALEHYEYRDCLSVLKEQLSSLKAWAPSAEEEKHWREEMATLRRMVFRYEKPSKHTFIGYRERAEVILLTNRGYREITSKQLPEGEIKMLAGGIRLVTEDLRKILSIRTYSQQLFPIKGTRLISPKPEEAASQLAESDLLPFLKRMHRGSAPFYYRIELKSKMPLEQKSQFLKKLTARLDLLTGSELLNMPGWYEVEVRLVENKDGRFIPLMRLCTLEDERFSYRKHALASSIAPVNGALFMELAKPYLTEGAQVLDPFCGVGTMLIERSRCKKADPLYGIDIYEEAVQKGRENARAAGVIIHFINRDFFDFQHEYLFDEIVSNLPGVTRTKDKQEIRRLYQRLFEKSSQVLKRGGLMLLYTTEPDLLQDCIRRETRYRILEKWVIVEREGHTLFAIRG